VARAKVEYRAILVGSEFCDLFQVRGDCHNKEHDIQTLYTVTLLAYSFPLTTRPRSSVSSDPKTREDDDAEANLIPSSVP